MAYDFLSIVLLLLLVYDGQLLQELKVADWSEKFTRAAN